MIKKIKILTIILITILYATLVLIFIFPSFYTFPPVDCIAGCLGTKGIPFTYYKFYGDAFGNRLEISYQYLLLDLIIWFIIVLLPSLIYSKIKTKHSAYQNKQK